MADVRRLEVLTREESLGLLRSVSVGRVVFTQFALPAIRAVTHLVEDDEIIIRADRSADIATANGVDDAIVVAYEADEIGLDGHLSWSVIVIGRARSLPDHEGASHYRQVLQPWVTGMGDDIIVIETDVVDGFRLVPDS